MGVYLLGLLPFFLLLLCRLPCILLLDRMVCMFLERICLRSIHSFLARLYLILLLRCFHILYLPLGMVLHFLMGLFVLLIFLLCMCCFLLMILNVVFLPTRYNMVVGLLVLQTFQYLS